MGKKQFGPKVGKFTNTPHTDNADGYAFVGFDDGTSVYIPPWLATKCCIDKLDEGQPVRIWWYHRKVDNKAVGLKLQSLDLLNKEVVVRKARQIDMLVEELWDIDEDLSDRVLGLIERIGEHAETMLELAGEDANAIMKEV